MRLNSLYIGVQNMNRALRFYETLLQKEPTHVEERFSYFTFDGFIFGLFYAAYENEDLHFGNNCIPDFEVDHIEDEYKRVLSLTKEIVLDLHTVGSYLVFQCKDSEGNTIEFYEQK